VRQPLAKLLIPVISQQVRDRLELVKPLILAEVNVKEAEFIADTTGIITKKIKPNFKTLGKKYGPRMKEIAAAFAGFDQKTISDIQAAGNYVFNLPSGPVELALEDYEISSEDMPGWLVASDGPLTIALDIEVSDELRREGIARELVNRIQNLRKDSGFDVTDKVAVELFADGEGAAAIAAALETYGDYLCAQTLATSVRIASGADPAAVAVEWDEGPLAIKVTKQ